MDIRVDDLQGADVIALLDEHVRDMEHTSPPGSRHVLDLAGLRQPGITFWTLRCGAELAGCAALKEIDPRHAEIKSMRTAASHRGRGVASALLRHLIEEAGRRGYRRLSLETGAMPFFEPARRLYASFGFVPCVPYAAYVPDPNSVFMTRELARPGDAPGRAQAE